MKKNIEDRLLLGQNGRRDNVFITSVLLNIFQ